MCCPACIAGSAVAGAISLGAGVSTVVPHGGIFVLFVPNATEKPLVWLLALLAGTAITTAVLFFTKRPIEQPARAPVAHRRRGLIRYGAANSSSWMLSGSRNTSTNAPGIVLAGAIGEHVTPSFASRAAHASSSSRSSTAKAR